MVEALLKGITIGLLLSIAVGPILFSVIKQSLNNGHQGGMAFAFGVSASDITLVLVANVFTELFRSLRLYETQIGIAGSVLLILMGIFFLYFKKVKVNEDGKLVFKQRKRDIIIKNELHAPCMLPCLETNKALAGQIIFDVNNRFAQ